MLTLWILFASSIFCFAQKNDLNSSIGRVDSFVGNGQYKEALELLDSIEKECLESKDDAVFISFLFNKGVVLQLCGKDEASIPLFERICMRYKKLGVKDDTYLASLSTIGGTCFRMGDYATSVDYFRKTVISCYSAIVSEDVACNYLSEAYLFLYDIYKKLDNDVLQKECLYKLEEIDRWKKTKAK